MGEHKQVQSYLFMHRKMKSSYFLPVHISLKPKKSELKKFFLVPIFLFDGELIREKDI